MCLRQGKESSAGVLILKLYLILASRGNTQISISNLTPGDPHLYIPLQVR
jgi:hypothetical protein